MVRGRHVAGQAAEALNMCARMSKNPLMAQRWLVQLRCRLPSARTIGRLSPGDAAAHALAVHRQYLAGLADPAHGRRVGAGAGRSAPDRSEFGHVCAAVCDCRYELIEGARPESGGRRIAALSPLTPGAVRGDRPGRRGAWGGAT